MTATRSAAATDSNIHYESLDPVATAIAASIPTAAIASAPSSPTNKLTSPLRMENLDDKTFDFVFEPFDVENANCFVKLLCKFELVRSILVNYGVKAVLALSSVYFCVKGVASNTTGMAYFPLLKNGFHVSDSATQQQLGYIAQMAWPMKPLIGLISDSLPISGYRKRWYLVSFAVLAIVCLVGIYILPADHTYSIQVVTALLFLLNLAFAGSDLLCESAYSRFMVLRREGGTSIISWVWGLFMLAGVIAAVLVGPLADDGEPRTTMIALVPFIAIALVPLMLNWLGERTVSQRKRRHVVGVVSNGDNSNDNDFLASDCEASTGNSVAVGVRSNHDSLATSLFSDANKQNQSQQQQQRPSVRSSSGNEGNHGSTNDKGSSFGTVVVEDEQRTWYECMLPCLFLEKNSDKRKMAFYSIVMGIAAPVSAAVSLWTANTGPYIALYFILAVVIILGALSFKCMPTVAAKANLYMFSKEALYFSTTGALNYFYTANSKCVPGGPAFSFTYYQTVSSIIGAFAGATGAFLFQKFFSKRTFRFVYIFTTCLRVFSSLFDVLLVTRANVHVGISDHVAYLLGDAMIYQCSYTLDFMPAVMLTAQLCPHGLEATMYAVLAGFTNFGYIFAGTIGAVLSDYFLIRTSEDSCDFTNLAPLVLVSHGVFPLLSVPLAYFLVPNHVIDVPLQHNESVHDEETQESLPLVAS